jgi:hypothetical protein
MRRGFLIGVMVAGLGLPAIGAAAEEDSRVLCPRELAREMQVNQRLAHYVQRNGMPDVAATQFLSDEGPWSERQVTLYYFDLRKEISFAKAYILGSRTISVERYERPLSDADIASLEPLSHPSQCSASGARYSSADPDDYPPGWGEGTGPGARAEAAAMRAEAAAQRVEAAAARTEQSAERAEAVLARLETIVVERWRK